MEFEMGDHYVPTGREYDAHISNVGRNSFLKVEKLYCKKKSEEIRRNQKKIPKERTA